MIAEEMAARNSLRIFFGLNQNREPLNFEFHEQQMLDINQSHPPVKQLM